MTDTNKTRLYFLLKAYIENDITTEEFDELVIYFHRANDEEDISRIMEAFWNAPSDDDSSDISKDSIYRNILRDPRFISPTPELAPNSAGHGRRKTKFAWPMIAAAIALLCTIGIVFHQKTGTDEKKENQAIAAKNNEEILPGHQQAILTLADGRQVDLELAENGELAVQGLSTIRKMDGEIVYKGGATDPSKAHLKNTISTPKGGEYKLSLPDGSKVWLNAASSITFPVAFSANERRVEIKGEAYFEIANNRDKPFIVNTKGTIIQVLGTHFNVSAYLEDNAVRTTLLKGAVKVSRNNQSKILTPGQQAIISNDKDEIKIMAVDTEEMLAWKNGYFLFKRENIQSVMEKVARWYDVEVEYQGNMQGKTFGGTISRFEQIDKLMKALEMTGTVHYKIEGRRIVIME